MPFDKQLHLVAGFAIAALAALMFIPPVCMAAGAGVWRALLCVAAGMMAGAVAAVTREFDGHTYGGRWDWADLAWTMLGALVGSQAGWLALIV